MTAKNILSKSVKIKKLVLIILVLLVFIQLASAGEIREDLDNVISDMQEDERIPVIISFKDKPSRADINFIKANNGNIKYKYDIIDAVAAEIPVRAVENIARSKSVEYVEPDYDVELLLDYSTNQIQANRVWNLGLTGKGIDVAIVDSGIHDEHPALTVEMEVDFTGEGTDDLKGHGTHVAGIVASSHSVYRGVAYDADLFNVKVIPSSGVGSASNVIRGIEWSVNNGAEVISMSLGRTTSKCDGTDSMSMAVDSAVDRGVVVVVAAGNSGPNPGTIASPGCARKAITVGMVNDSDVVTSGSGRGPTYDGRVKPDLVAPGSGIRSTWGDGFFNSMGGTSMATPHVSGVVALLLEADSSLSPDEIKEILMSGALDLGLDGNTQGAGRVDAYESYNIWARFKPSVEFEPIGDSSSIRDLSGSGNIIINSGATLMSGKINSALGFDGVDDIGSASDSGSLDISNQVTVEAWIKPDVNSRRTILAKCDNYWLETESDGRIRWSVNNGGLNILTSLGNKYKVGEWNYFVGIYDGQYMRAYVNGVEVASKLVGGSLVTNNFDLTVGARKSNCYGGGGWFDGAIDFAAVYDRVLSDSEISEHYNNYLSGIEPNLGGSKAYYNFEVDIYSLSVKNNEASSYRRVSGEESFRVVNEDGSELGEAIYKGNLFYEENNLIFFLGEVSWNNLVLKGICYSNLPSSGVSCLYVGDNQEEDIIYYNLKQDFDIIGTNTITVKSFERNMLKYEFESVFDVLENDVKVGDLRVNGDVIEDSVFIGSIFVRELGSFYSDEYFGLCYLGDSISCYAVYEGSVL